MSGLQDICALVGRFALALIFIIEGWIKIAGYSATIGYMEAQGVPGALLPPVILTELGGGLLVAAGLFTRCAALSLAGFCLLTAIIFHLEPGNANQFVHFLKNVAMAGGFLLLAAFGPGGVSLDRWRALRRGVS